MPIPKPLPAELIGRTFDVTTARMLGVSINRLRAGDLTTLSRGIRSPADRQPELIEHAAAVLAESADGWLSHTTAAELHGLWLPKRLTRDGRIHLSRESVRTAARRRHVNGHAVRADGDEVIILDGLRISSPPRTWLELMPGLTREEAVVIGDQLVRLPRRGLDARVKPWCTLPELAELVARYARRPGVQRAREALALIRIGSDSPSETRLRLAIVGAGLPEPELQLRLDPEDPYAPETDMGYRHRRIALQHEGPHHLQASQQSHDIRRDEQWLAAGFRIIRSDVSDTRTRFVRVLNVLRPLLDSAEDAA